MKVKISSDIGENIFDLKESAVFSLLSAALALQNGKTAVVEPNATYVDGEKAESKPVSPKVETKAEPVKAPTVKRSRTDSMFGSGWKEEKAPVATPAPVENNPWDEDGYKGFLIVKCQHCGEVKGFCSKVPPKYYKCEHCGESTDLKGLRKAFVNCECGKRYKYQTNITDNVFDYNCISCGYPVPLQYNAKKNVYQTMQ